MRRFIPRLLLGMYPARVSHSFVALAAGMALVSGTLMVPSATAVTSDGTVDAVFASHLDAAALGFDEVKATLVLPSGELLVAGTTYGSPGRLVKLSETGTVVNSFSQPSFGTNFDNGAVYSIVADGSGNIYVAGSFRSVTQSGATTTSPLLAKFNSSGILDQTLAGALSDTSTGIAAYVSLTNSSCAYAVALDSSDRLYLGGTLYTQYNAPWANEQAFPLMRLSAAGVVDTNYSPLRLDAWSNGGNGYDLLNQMLMQPDGSIYAVGWFGSNAASIQKVDADGTTSATFAPPVSIQYSLYSIAVQPDGKVLIGGVNDASNGYLVRLTTTGSIDSSFTPPTLGGYYPSVNAIVLSSDGSVTIGGSFTGYLKRLDSAGSEDAAFATNVSASTLNGYINAMSVAHNGSLLVAGALTTPSHKVTQFYVAPPTYAVTLQHGASATGADVTYTIAQGDTFTLPSATSCASGDPCFTGPVGGRPRDWSLTTGTLSGSSYPARGATITPTSDVTLNARWTGALAFSTTSYGTPSANIAFPTSAPGSLVDLVVYVRNVGETGAAISAFSNWGVSGSNLSDPNVTTCTSNGLAAGAECTFKVRWSPAAAGVITSSPQLQFQADGYFDTVTLSGLAVNSYSVNYVDSTCATVTANGTFQQGGSLALPTAPTACSGQRFAGWFLAPMGGMALPSPYTPGVSANISLYAQWTSTRSPDPIQTDAVSLPAVTSGAPGTLIEIPGTFGRPIARIEVGGRMVDASTWSQSATRVKIQLPAWVTGTITIQIFNGAVPLLKPIVCTVVAIEPTPTPTPTPTLTPTPSPAIKAFKALTVYFDEGASTLSVMARAAIDAWAVGLRGLKSPSITITGLVRPTRSKANDKALSLARAKSVARELVRLGITAPITVRGAGAAPNSEAKARRAELVAVYVK